jgi:hypothetical protein
MIMHNINYRINFTKPLPTKVITYVILFLTFQTAYCQKINALPKLDSLFNSIDTFYNKNCEAKKSEFKESKAKLWTNYIPNIGYSPFAGGFNISFDLDRPFRRLQEKKNIRSKVESIQRICELEISQEKNLLAAEYSAVEIMILEFHFKDEMEKLKEDEFKLISKQYDRNEVLPTVFFNKKEELQALRIARFMEVNKINQAITQLFIKAKSAIYSPSNENK